ncbi:transcription initiation factor TFIID subunit 3 [Kryptolebias marmoratus]|uniref:transcription initiation factor TFIID subunit 3 n=1 Tax=Kryptolebias marmoratus TaxID=37003 RepID=UPI0007F93764|nr:transcription initiation factor TFIID subunit 3 [Kryptolebias marmoratus]
MCESYARSLLRVSVAQICQALGWDAVQLTASDLLSDVLHRYIQQLARVCHRYSELYGRTDPVLDDVSQAFRLMGVNLSELEDYVHNLEPVAFTHQTPLFPVSKNNVLQFPQPGVRDAEERKDYIPDHMPPLVSLQEEEEEEEVPPDMGTSAEAMQVALEEDEEDMDEDEAVNDENHPLKRHLDSPNAALGMMPTSKKPRMYPGLSPEWGVEPREPLTSLNPQRVPPGILPSHDSLDPLSPEMPSGTLPPFRPQPVVPKLLEQKGLPTPTRKPKVSSPGRQRTKSPKGVLPVPVVGSPIHSPKPSKERKKSPGRTKSPKSPKSPKMGSAKTPQPPSKVDVLHKLPLSALSERMGKENIHMRLGGDERELLKGPFEKLEPDNTAIDDSIDAVIARACAEREPDPFAFSSGSDSDSNGFSSPRRLTIMEPSIPKVPPGVGSLFKDTSTPLHLQPHLGLGNWTMDDSINEVIRKANQGGPSAPPPNPVPYVSSGSASPPTPEPLLKVFEEKNKMVSPLDVKKKLKKELKTKLKKKDKEKTKDKEREKDKSKLKEKNKDKSRDKNKESSKEVKMPWKDFGLKDEDHFAQRDFTLPEGSIKIKSRDGDGPKKDKEKHKDKKKDKEKSKKDKDKKDKSKDRSKEDKQKQSVLPLFSLADMPPLFSPSTCLRIPSMLPPLAPILHEKEAKSKDKEKKKDKKEKKKKKDKEKDKEREKAKEKEREKEEKRKEKEREKEKREKEKDKEKEKERIRLEKVKMETPAALPSPVIPRLTLRVGAGQDKIVISKVVPNSEPKTPGPRTPASKSAPGNRPRTPLPPPMLAPVVPSLPPLPASSLPPAPPSAASLFSPPSSMLPPPPPASTKTPVRSVVTETVSTYVIRDEWGNQIWICPGCNKPDDGSPMIGCEGDGCDDWYHWPCVGILTPPPEDQQWFCVKCSSKKKDKKHKKKKHKPH